ncbi:MAG TPA: VOC family protein [Mycobacterium sp.]|nr:VOC family protein [Mycobacterium sp.]HPZ95625.1 VOC family protein [Mycobacterium sp.]HQE14559.1 VOC family protein [Mycobacterium sp.]
MNGTLSVEMVTFDCVDPDRLARWWSTALSGEIVPVVPGEFLIVAHDRGPRLGFQRVAEPTPGKARIHLDFATSDMEGEVRRLVELGASEVGRHAFGDFGWVVLEDPDGNVFCVAPVMG